MDEQRQVVWGRLEADGAITELGRTDPGADPITEVPGYAAALRKGTNVSFAAGDAHFEPLVRKPEPKADGRKKDAPAKE